MSPRQAQKRRQRAVALTLSLLLSVLVAPLLWLGGVTALRPGDEVQEDPGESAAADEEPQDFEVVTVFEPPEPPEFEALQPEIPIQPVAEELAEPEFEEVEEEPEPLFEEVVEEEVVEEEPEPMPTPPEPEPEQRQSVVQHESNDEVNPFAEYLAEQDNTVAVETIAEDAVLDNDEAGNEQAGESELEVPDEGAEQEYSEELAMVDVETEELEASDNEGDPDAPPEELPETTVEESPQTDAPHEVAEEQAAEPRMVPDEQWVPLPTVENVERLLVENETGEFALAPEEVAQTPPGALDQLRLGASFDHAQEILEASGGEPTMVAEVAHVHPEVYNDVFGDRDDEDREHLEQVARESQLVGDHEGRWERTRASMENFGVDVRTGTETHLNTQSSAYATYISYIHNKIHPRFEDFIFSLEFRHGPTSPLADPSLHTQVLYVIASSGEVEDVQIMSTSGSTIFDGTIIDMLYDIGPHEPPPPVFLSSNGNAYIEWNFHRNQRMCGTFGAFPRFVGGDDPVDEGK